MEAGGGHFGWSLVIEGYENLLTTSDDTAAVVTAWSGTGWSAALAGLVFDGMFEQSIKPWDHLPDIPTFTFSVYDVTGLDTFGKAVWKSKPTFETRLTSTLSATDGATSVGVNSNSGLAASGTVYIGRERVNYASLSGSTSLVVNALNTGVLAPFVTENPQGSGSTFPHHHTTSPLQNLAVAANPRVTDSPRTGAWLGRLVGLYLHRISGTVWDTRAQAELVFAGTIKDLQDHASGATVMVCEDIRAKLRDTVFLRDQFRGRVTEGIRLVAGHKFSAREGISGAADTVTTTDFSIVTSGASGSNEINEGYWPLPELFARMNDWLATVGGLTASWSIQLVSSDSGIRTQFKATFPTTAAHQIILQCTQATYLQFMGFTAEQINVYEGRQSVSSSETWSSYGTTAACVSRNVPYKVKPFQHQVGVSGGEKITLTHTEGTWRDLSRFLPQPLRDWAGGSDFGLLQVGDKTTVFAKHDTDTTFSEIRRDDPFTFATVQEEHQTINKGITWDQEGDIPVKQVVVFAGPLRDIFPMLFASIAGNRINHPDYDVLPFGAAIPWALLGTNFVNSCKQIEQSSGGDGLCIVIEKPTPLFEILESELALRFAWLVWKSGGLRFVSPPVPNATTADHALTEDNKGAAAGVIDPQTTVTEVTSEHLRNVIKIEYNRTLANNYQDTITIRDDVSVGEIGEERPVTIKARNSYGDKYSGTATQTMAANLAARCAPVYGRPFKRFKRPLLGTKWLGMTPGDTASLADNFTRDPTTGARAISNRACTVSAVRFSFGQQGTDNAELMGECELMWTEEDRTFPLSPCADVDETYSSSGFTAGYHSGDKKLKFKQHAYSQSADSKDVTHFAASDVIRVITRDPYSTTTADTFTDTIASVDTANDTITLTTGFGGANATFDSASYYRVLFASYTSCVSTQQDTAFQADDGDALIQDTIEPNLYGETTQLTFGDIIPSVLPERHATQLYGEGTPLTPAHGRMLGSMVNNLLNFKVPNAPWYHDKSSIVFNGGNQTDWICLMIFPLSVPEGQSPVGRTRLVHAACRHLYGAGGGTTASEIRVTLSRFPPRSNTTGAAGVLNVTFTDPVSQATTRTTSLTTVTSSIMNLIPFNAVQAPFTFMTVEGRGNGQLDGFPLLMNGPLWQARYPRTLTNFRGATGLTVGPTSMWLFINPSGSTEDVIGTNDLDFGGGSQRVFDIGCDAYTFQVDDGTGQSMELVDNTKLDITTGSFAIFWIGAIQSVPTTTRGLLGKRTATAGYSLDFTTASILQFNVDGTAVQTETVDLTNYVNEPIGVLAVYDTNANSQKLHVCIRGEVTSSTGTTAANGNLTNTDTFNVGDFGVGSSQDATHAWCAFLSGTDAQGLGATHLNALMEYVFGI